jgi:hypothetical protein
VAVTGNAAKGALYGSRNPAGYRPSDPKSTVAVKKIAVVQRSRVSKVGDNSNAQYAALGLRSCAEAGLVLDPRCLQDALHWWEGDQDRDGGWGYSRGEDDAGRATMTAGGIGSLVIFHWMLHKPWAGDAHVRLATRVAGAASTTSDLHSTTEPIKLKVDRYTITMIGMTPYPGTGRDTDTPVVILRVSSE